MNVVEVEIPCDICRKPYITQAIDGHITFPHICESCMIETVKEWENQMKDTIQKIEWSTWKCVDVSPNGQAADDWAWRKKYEGLIGHICVYDYREIMEKYRMKFFTNEGQGFVTAVDEFVLDGDILTVITGRSIYKFCKE